VSPAICCPDSIAFASVSTHASINCLLRKLTFSEVEIFLHKNCEYCYIPPLNLHLNTSCFLGTRGFVKYLFLCPWFFAGVLLLVAVEFKFSVVDSFNFQVSLIWS
jgi:hypothetical protein